MRHATLFTSAFILLFIGGNAVCNAQELAAEAAAVPVSTYKTVGLLLLLIVIAVEAVLVHLSKEKRKSMEEARLISEQYNRYMEEYARLEERLALLQVDNEDRKRQIEAAESRVKELETTLVQFQVGPQTGSMSHQLEALHQSPIVAQFHQLATLGRLPKQEEWMELRKALASFYPEYLPSLMQKASLSRKETGICILVKLRFIPSEMSMLLATSMQNVSTLRSRLYKKLFGKAGKAADFDAAIRSADRF